MHIPPVRLLFLALALTGAGCRSVPPSEQARVAKPNMVFAEGAAFAERGALQSQIEPGSTSTGGGQAAGCTSCK